MKYWLIVKLVYKDILRPLVAEKVASSDTTWDDFALSLLDKLFDYSGEK